MMTLLDELRYRIWYARMRSKPDRVQQAIGRQMYETIYASYADKAGSNFATTTVEFECPYKTHVLHHVTQTLKQRAENPADPTTEFSISNEKNTYKLTVSVMTSVEKPMLVSDASAMSAILRLPIVSGDMERTSHE